MAYKAHTRIDLLDGVDEFLDQVTVLPPGEWDPNIRIEPPSHVPSQEKRKLPEMQKVEFRLLKKIHCFFSLRIYKVQFFGQSVFGNEKIYVFLFCSPSKAVVKKRKMTVFRILL